MRVGIELALLPRRLCIICDTKIRVIRNIPLAFRAHNNNNIIVPFSRRVFITCYSTAADAVRYYRVTISYY